MVRNMLGVGVSDLSLTMPDTSNYQSSTLDSTSSTGGMDWASMGAAIGADVTGLISSIWGKGSTAAKTVATSSTDLMALVKQNQNTILLVVGIGAAAVVASMVMKGRRA